MIFKIFKIVPQPSNVEKRFQIDTKDKQLVEATKEEPKIKPRKVPTSIKFESTKIGKQFFCLKVVPSKQIRKKF